MKYQKPICTNDYGESVYLCRYTDSLILASEALSVGSTIPNVSVTYYMAKTPDAYNAMKLSRYNFNLTEANCNTCSLLIRAKHPKTKDGILIGKCHLNKELKFHPHDPMHKLCYVPRVLLINK